MTFKAWHWKDLDGGGRRETGREDGGGWFEKVFLHLNITGKVLILKAKVNWSFHLLSLASPLRLRTRRASQKRRRGFCLKRFGDPHSSTQIRCKCGYGLDILNSYGKYGNGFENVTAPFIIHFSQNRWRPCLQEFDDYYEDRVHKSAGPVVFLSKVLFQLFPPDSFTTDTCRASMIQPTPAEHQWYNRYLQSIYSSTDIFRAWRCCRWSGQTTRQSLSARPISTSTHSLCFLHGT